MKTELNTSYDEYVTLDNGAGYLQRKWEENMPLQRMLDKGNEPKFYHKRDKVP